MNNLYSYAKSKFLPTSGFRLIDPKDYELNKYTNNSSKECVLEADFEYPEELRELHNDYPLAIDQIEKCYLIINYRLLIFIISFS